LPAGLRRTAGLLLGFALGTPALAAESFRDCPECPEMVVVPAGRFVMGAAPGEEAREHLAEEFRGRSEPRRAIDVRRFAVGRFEVTRAQYRAFADATGRRHEGCFDWSPAGFVLDLTKDWRQPGFAQDDRHAVACVSWEDAAAYVEWLARRTGRAYRLPTEAEWEYAARAGTTTSRHWGDDGEAGCAFANGADRSTVGKVPLASTWGAAACDDGHAWTAPVGSFPANAFGLHDMLGNVAEWTQDCWNARYDGLPSDGRAAATGDCSMRAVRGGAWDDAPTGLRAAYRVGSPTVVRVRSRGLRVALDP